MGYPEPSKDGPQVLPIRQDRPNTVRPLLKDSLNLSGSLPQPLLEALSCKLRVAPEHVLISKMLEATAINMTELKMNVRVK